MIHVTINDKKIWVNTGITPEHLLKTRGITHGIVWVNGDPIHESDFSTYELREKDVVELERAII